MTWDISWLLILPIFLHAAVAIVCMQCFSSCWSGDSVYAMSVILVDKWPKNWMIEKTPENSS